MSMARSPSLPTTIGSETVWSPMRSSAVSGVGDPAMGAPSERGSLALDPSRRRRGRRGSGASLSPPAALRCDDQQCAAALSSAEAHLDRGDLLDARPLLLGDDQRGAALADEALDVRAVAQVGD